MRLRRWGLLSVLFSALAFSNCDCDPELQRVAPKIEIADPFDPSASACADQGFRDCAYDFGEVPIGQARLFRFVIKNPSPVDLKIDSVAFTDDSDPAFRLNTLPPKAVVAAAGEEGEEVVVQFTPTLEAEVFGSLVIRSDAANLEEGEDVIIRFSGRGLDVGSPVISVNPTSCDFADVGIGVTAFCDLSIENVGQRELLVTGIGFTAETSTSVFQPSGFFPIPTAIQPGTGVSFRLQATPNLPGEIMGTLLIDSTDPGNGQVSVPLRVYGAEAPTAIAEVKTINGSVPPAGSTQVRPLDDVVLTGVNSQAALPTGQIMSYQWEIVEKPVESSVQLSQPNAMETGFFFSSSVGNRPGVDVAGTFVVRLRVTDDQGLTSTNDARVTLSSVPSERLHVQLTWDSPTNDIDLYLTNTSNFGCNTSCNFRNCKPTNILNYPEWDGISGRTAGDPTLDVDDLSGYGPENINVDAPVNGTYTAGVHAWSLSQTTTVTVKIFVNGGLAFEGYRTMSATDQFWRVAEVQWLNGGAVVVPVDTFQSNWSCF